MGDVWGGLAAGLGTASNIAIQQYMQDLEAKVKEQERENEERRKRALEDYKAKLAREGRAGTLHGTPTPSYEDGSMYGYKWNEDGTQQEYGPVGAIPEGMLSSQRNEQERKRELEAIDLDNKRAQGEQRRSAASLNAARERDLASGGGGGATGKQPSVTETINAEKRAEEVASREFRDFVSSDGVPRTSPKQGQTQEELDEGIRKYRDRVAQLTRQYLYPQIRDELDSYFYPQDR